jgi:hypothetical protein
MSTRGAFVAFSGVAIALGGACGQDVETCATVCGLPDAPTEECARQCTATETACAMLGCSADFQLYLACLSNAETFDAVYGAYASIAKTVSAESSLAVAVPPMGPRTVRTRRASAFVPRRRLKGRRLPAGSASAPAWTSAARLVVRIPPSFNRFSRACATRVVSRRSW